MYAPQLESTPRTQYQDQPSIIDATVTLVEGTVSVVKSVVTAPYHAFMYFWPESKSSPPVSSYKWEQELRSSKYYKQLHLHLEYSVYSRLNEDKKLIICAAAASMPDDPDDDDETRENKRKILMALIASAMLTGTGIAIVYMTGSTGLLPTLFIEAGNTGANHCLEAIRSNKKFLWKEWAGELVSSAVETIVLTAANKVREAVPVKLKGKVNRKVINAFCNVYDLIEPYSNVIVYAVTTDELDSKELAFEFLKSIDEKYSTSLAGVTVYETKMVRKSITSMPYHYRKVEKTVSNIQFKIFFDQTVGVRIY